jgi:hypothetical protein
LKVLLSFNFIFESRLVIDPTSTEADFSAEDLLALRKLAHLLPALAVCTFSTFRTAILPFLKQMPQCSSADVLGSFLPTFTQNLFARLPDRAESILMGSLLPLLEKIVLKVTQPLIKPID